MILVGDAWIRAMHTGVADPNPYDGVDFGKVDLWTGTAAVKPAPAKPGAAGHPARCAATR